MTGRSGFKSRLRGFSPQIVFRAICFSLLNSQKVKVSTRGSGSARKEFSLYEYNQYDEIVQYLREVEQSCPKIVKLLSIGKTTEKRRLWLVQISTARRGARRPFVLLEAGSHAREWIGPATALYIISRLVGEDCGATGLSKYLDWHIIPLFNPDGYEYTHTRDRMWRKTRSTLENTTCKGVDVNRNFDFHWGQTGASLNQCLFYLTDTGASLNQCLCYLTETGASLNPCQSDYAGPKPFSEPEARALRNYVLSDAKRILLYVSLHSYGKVGQYTVDREPSTNKVFVLTTQRSSWALVQILRSRHGTTLFVLTAIDSVWELKKTLADKANKAIIDEGGEPYFIGTAPQLLYSASGSSLDWMRGVGGVKYGFVAELPGGGKEGFDMPPTGINKTAREFFAALRVFGELANKKGKIFMGKRQLRSYRRKIRRNMIRLRKFHR
uniref:Peptidase M14 domain-containing protein n=1 Tax=Timema poppense TaxID=170557 RepID=A0A7R9GZT6_TIMPO|nr:unnamed protein product [Timema poppensis]